MNITLFRRASQRLSMRKGGIALSLTLIGGLFISNAHAQVLVTDITTETQTAATYGETVTQYAEQVQQYATQLQQYQQMLSQIQGLTSGLSLLPNTLQHADLATMTQANCGSSAGIANMIGNALSSAASEVTGETPFPTQQTQICVQIVYYQVDQYNKTVDMLNQVNNYGTMFTNVENTINSVTTQADSGRAATQAADYNNAITTQMANWNSQMQADKAIIEALQNMQSQLAKAQMGANPDFLGQGIQAAALTGAFKIGT